MRIILKIILFPVSLVLSILTAFLTFSLGIGTTILYFLMSFCVIGSIASFIYHDTVTGIQALVIAFLVSPYGLPMIGAFCIALIETVNCKIRAI